jgi:uncharacterized repeat protein (TIGR02543 family)
VKAQARCAAHIQIVSGWSVGLAVTIVNPTTTVSTLPAGLQIQVDGQTYTAPQTFIWIPGSSHTIAVSSPQTKAGEAGTLYVYAAWSDGGNQSHTVASPSLDTNYTAGFTTQYSLTTSANPTAGGTVNPAGTTWCNANAAVLVSATANTGYTFSGWSGSLTDSTNPSNLTMTGPKTATAGFSLNTYTLTVTKTGNGAVTSSPAGINCGADCSETYNYATQVVLTATADSGWTFTGWGGSCSGTSGPSCTVSITAATGVSATFNSGHLLTVTKAGTGTGDVSPNDGTLSWIGNTGTSAYNNNTSVTLTASAGIGSTFSGWSGDCSNAGTCQVTMDNERNVTATFMSDCSGDVVVLQNMTFTSGNTYNCTATTSITAGTGVIVRSGAIVNFRAPNINLQPGFSVESGAVFSVKQ